MNLDSGASLVGRGSSGRDEWMSFDSSLVLITQEHNGYITVIYLVFKYIYWSDLNAALGLWILVGTSFN